ncbi:hypothetical protein [Deinococcus humi]|uniref:Expansin (Peptidoglycan-binding protein) n=1 Tax=Deinococcus humi TaxID=662880 RepID=A0A7W8K351_9DEIO|nr:hypothetical protein [Deinococcus humi]MBB5366429.1 expansin (peptidoglycan-binding protein) [Deinococcus humi]GGO41853.1 hypothetical protein GCM10008949_53180 [Deinococcus humi]
MKNNKHNKGTRPWPLLGFALLAGLTVACTKQAIPLGWSGLGIHLNAGETTTYDVDLYPVQALTFDLHPHDPAQTATATGGTLTIGGQTLKASVNPSNIGNFHAGDLSAIFWKCTQVRPGKNVEVRYAFTDASGQTLEQGSAFLGNVTGTCPVSR